MFFHALVKIIELLEDLFLTHNEVLCNIGNVYDNDESAVGFPSVGTFTRRIS